MGTGFSEVMTILSQVDGFYNSARDKLIITCSIAFGIIGILVPLLIQRYQNHSLKQNEKTLKEDINNKSEKVKITLEESLNKKFEELEKQFSEEVEKKLDLKIEEYNKQVEEYKKEINEQIEYSKACPFYLQAKDQRKIESFKDAISSYISAAKGFIKAKSHRNLQSSLESIEILLPKLKEGEIKQIKIEIDELLEELSESHKEGFYEKTISEIKSKIDDPKK